MNEDSLQKLVRAAMKRGDVPLRLDDDMVDSWIVGGEPELTDALKSGVKSRLKFKIQDAALARAAGSVDATVIPFGRFIETIRDRAGLTKKDVAERLLKSEEYVQDIERDRIDVTQLTSGEFADLVELFRMAFRVIADVVRATASSPDYSPFYGSAAVGLRGTPHSERVDGAVQVDPQERLQRIARARGGNAETCLLSLRQELIRRQRADLLG
jgi:transcriptional regulator with XRE-family HTH domain